MTDSGSADSVSAANQQRFVQAVQRYADSVLVASALRTDRDGIGTARVSELANTGLLNHAATGEFGGAAVDPNGDRRIREILAGACLNTWLLWAQHAPLVQLLGKRHSAGQQLSDLAYEVLRGRLLVGAGISDVRRYPAHYVAAARRAGGWTLSGTISWVTGWGLVRALAVAGVEPATESVITALVPVGERTTASVLDLSAVAGSRTERVELRDVEVPDHLVISIESLNHWRTKDLGMSSHAQPHHFGLADRGGRELEREPDPRARAVAATWRPRIADLRRDAYALADEVIARDDGSHRVRERIETKVAIGDALNAVTRALLVARAGRGICFDDTAQLHARSALFLLVQGQSADIRSAQLDRLAEQDGR